ncbi:MAG TPA: PAS domain S-box protein [Syntrophobacteraceae bacterium]|nr:PAS domain S-box protein [Syntrophobacteraceae bacterium]
MADKAPSPKSPLAIGVFAGALFVTSILLVLTGWHIWDSYSDSKMIQSKDFRLIELSWTVFHRDEVLVMSVRMAATTGKPEWEKRYREYAPQVSSAIAEAKALYSEEHISEAISQVDAINRRLTALEERAFDMVRRGDREGALDLLASDEYEKEMLICSEVSVQLISTVRTHMESALGHQGRQAYRAVAWAAAALPVLLTTWFSALMMLKRYLNERNRAEAALRRSEERYRMLVETMNEGLATQDENRIITYVNDTFCKMLGYAKEELMGKPLATVFAESSRSVFEGEMARRMTGLRTTYEAELARKDGHRITAIISAAPLTDEHGSFKGAIGTVTDITARKQAEESLRLYAARLERSNEELQEFTFVASHHLQEPLRKIRVFNSLFSTKYKNTLDCQGRCYLERMDCSASRAQSLIHALLGYSRIAATPKASDAVSVRDAIEGALADLKDPIEKTEARIEYEGDPCRIEADREQLRTLFRGIIDNAVKFRGKERPAVRIHSRITNGYCETTIEDKGIGFDEKYLNMIFRPFQRLHKEDEYRGIGIGLALSRKIAENHNGSITAKSIPGEGSAFTVSLPVSRGANPSCLSCVPG